MNIPQPSDQIEPIPQAIPTDSDGMVFCLVNMFRVLKSKEFPLCASIGLSPRKRPAGTSILPADYEGGLPRN
jgi:hypothetical protein